MEGGGAATAANESIRMFQEEMQYQIMYPESGTANVSLVFPEENERLEVYPSPGGTPRPFYYSPESPAQPGYPAQLRTVSYPRLGGSFQPSKYSPDSPAPPGQPGTAGLPSAVTAEGGRGRS